VPAAPGAARTRKKSKSESTVSTLERRFLSSSQVRAIVPVHYSSSPGTLEGYAARHGVLSSNLGGFREKIAEGAFHRSLRNGDDVRCNFNHSDNYILGRVKNGTLRLRSDAIGLHNSCDLPDTSYARDLLENVRNGNVTEQSFAFTVEDEDWGDEPDPDERDSRVPVRTLRSVKLVDTAFVVQPAYPGTSVSADAAGSNAGRSHSFEQLFPAGLPTEIRSRVPDVRERLEFRRDQRRRLTNSVLSI
jgi:HK97 family phage prohead protease